MKYHIIVLLCILSVGLSSCAYRWAGKSQKSPELVAQPKRMYISFEGSTPFIGFKTIDKYALALQRRILQDCSQRGIQAFFVHNDNTSILSASEQQQQIRDFDPEVVMSIIQNSGSSRQFVTFDVKITTPDKEKILWRNAVYSSGMSGALSVQTLQKNIAYRLEKDGVFAKK